MDRQGETEQAAKRPKTEESLRDRAKRELVGFDPEAIDAMSEKEILQELIKQALEEKQQLQKKLEEKQQLQKKLELLKRLRYKYSLYRLITSPPVMTLDRKGHRTFRDTRRFHDTSSSRHNTASAIEHEITLQEGISEELSDQEIVSRLIVRFDANNVEGDWSDVERSTLGKIDSVSSFVFEALRDAKNLASSVTGRKFYAEYGGCSLFSNQADHLVLWDRETLDPILVVETQAPRDSKGAQEISGTVLGKLYDHLLDLRIQGRAAPFVVFSNFYESWLFWQRSAYSNNLVTAENKLNALGNAASPSQKTTPTTMNALPLPPSEVKNIPDCVFQEIPREDMHQSKEAFGPDKLVPLLYTAILCAISADSSESVSNHPGGYDGIALRLDRNSYGWGTLKLTEGEPVSKWQGTHSHERKVPCEEDETYFAINTIARGATAKVFNGYDSRGRRCVIKMCLDVEKPEEQWCWFPMLNREKIEVATVACKLEVKRLKAFYDFLEGEVHYKELYGFPCVIMPFFEPLTHDERNKSKKDPSEIQSCLSLFRDVQGRHWQYRDCDLEWYHVGYFVEGSQRKLVMFDLAELEEVEKEEFENAVCTQVENLIERLPRSEEEGSTSK